MKKEARLIEECPECRSTVREVWACSRMFQKECNGDECDWKSEPFAPPQKPIFTVKDIYTNQGGWCYEMFDKYGQTVTWSRGYSSKEECEKAALADIERTSGPHKDGSPSPYGECVAVIWPPTVQVTGTLIERQRSVL